MLAPRVPSFLWQVARLWGGGSRVFRAACSVLRVPCCVFRAASPPGPARHHQKRKGTRAHARCKSRATGHAWYATRPRVRNGLTGTARRGTLRGWTRGTAPPPPPDRRENRDRPNPTSGPCSSRHPARRSNPESSRRRSLRA